MPLGNHTWNIGDINGDIYFDKHTNKEGLEVPFIRLLMICNGTAQAKPIYGLRIVAYGALAEMAYGFLKKGSRIGVEGHIQQRDRGNNLPPVFEIVADHIEFIRHIDYERGSQVIESLKARDRVEPSRGMNWHTIPEITCGYSEGDENIVTVR
ncbi:single-stranded DNA-binding protein [bacterium]|nr:MAG: single-stranded DNA-binding protein [bacterium]